MHLVYVRSGFIYKATTHYLWIKYAKACGRFQLEFVETYICLIQICVVEVCAYSVVVVPTGPENNLFAPRIFLAHPLR